MPEESSDKRRRAVAQERKISGINKDDSRVSVVGTLLSIDKESFIFTIEDPSGQLTVLALTEDSIKDLSVGGVVRVIGMVLPFDEGFELRAEVIQDFKSLSPELFPVLHELM